MNYFFQVLGKAWSDTRAIVADAPVVSLLIGVVVSLGSIYFYTKWKTKEDAKDKIAELLFGGISVAIVFALVFIAHLFYFSHKNLNQEIKDKLAASKAESNKITSDKDIEIDRLKQRISDLEKFGALAELLQKQGEKLQKGSLENRANLLAKELLEFDNSTISESSIASTANFLEMNRSTTKEEEQRKWDQGVVDSTQRMFEKYGRFDQEFTPRIIAIRSEFKAGGKSHPDLDKITFFNPTSLRIRNTAFALYELAGTDPNN